LEQYQLIINHEVMKNNHYTSILKLTLTLCVLLVSASVLYEIRASRKACQNVLESCEQKCACTCKYEYKMTIWGGNCRVGSNT